MTKSESKKRTILSSLIIAIMIVISISMSAVADANNSEQAGPQSDINYRRVGH